MRIKTLTSRDFFKSPDIIGALHPGQSVLVTDRGQPALVVTKAGKRPRKTRADLEREAREICQRKGPKLDLTAGIRDLKGR